MTKLHAKITQANSISAVQKLVDELMNTRIKTQERELVNKINRDLANGAGLSPGDRRLLAQLAEKYEL